MGIDEINRIQKNIFLDLGEIKEYTKNGIIGLYACILKSNELSTYSYEYDKYIEELTDEELFNYIKKNFNIISKKYSSIMLSVYSKDVNNDFLQLLNAIPYDVPILLELVYSNDIDFDLLNAILNDKQHSIYVKNNMVNQNSESLEFLSKAKNQGRLIKSTIDEETHNNKYVIDNYLIDDEISLTIDNTNNPNEVINKIKNVTSLITNNLCKNIIVNINITDIRFFKSFSDIINNLEMDEEYPYDRIKYNLILDSIEEQIGYHDTDRYKYMSNDVSIECNGMEFNNSGEYQYFHNFTKLILSKIPENATELDKVVYISKFLINYLNYDRENYKKVLEGIGEVPMRNFYELSSIGVGVCRDYAKLTEYLLNKIGIECKYIASETYDYQNDINIPGKIKFNQSNGQVLDRKYQSHAFNLVYIDGKPYFLDNTWIDKENKLFNNENFLVSTDTFMKTHGEYVEVKKYECPENYSRYDISKSESMIEMFWFNYTDEELNTLWQLGQTSLAQKSESMNTQKR